MFDLLDDPTERCSFGLVRFLWRQFLLNDLIDCQPFAQYITYIAAIAAVCSWLSGKIRAERDATRSYGRRDVAEPPDIFFAKEGDDWAYRSHDWHAINDYCQLKNRRKMNFSQLKRRWNWQNVRLIADVSRNQHKISAYVLFTPVYSAQISDRKRMGARCTDEYKPQSIKFAIYYLWHGLKNEKDDGEHSMITSAFLPKMPDCDAHLPTEPCFSPNGFGNLAADCSDNSPDNLRWYNWLALWKLITMSLFERAACINADLPAGATCSPSHGDCAANNRTP